MKRARKNGKAKRLSADVDAALLVRLKAYCAREGRTIRGVVIRGILREIDGAERTLHTREVAR